MQNSFKTVDKAVLQYYTYLILQCFGFVLIDRNNFNNFPINTILLYKNNIIQTINNHNKSNNPNNNPTRMLKIWWLQPAALLMGTCKMISEIASQLLEVVSSKHLSQNLYKVNPDIQGRLHVMISSMSRFEDGQDLWYHVITMV